MRRTSHYCFLSLNALFLRLCAHSTWQFCLTSGLRLLSVPQLCAVRGLLDELFPPCLNTIVFSFILLIIPTVVVSLHVSVCFWRCSSGRFLSASPCGGLVTRTPHALLTLHGTRGNLNLLPTAVDHLLLLLVFLNLDMAKGKAKAGKGGKPAGTSTPRFSLSVKCVASSSNTCTYTEHLHLH